jgi:type II secretory ATPase GspE/PulE/Tfp pilus assembly ATPase PilB-like protein
MEVEPFLLSSALAGVVAQRLVRRVCDRCKTTADVPRSLRDELGVPPDVRFLKGKGCVVCGHSGYKGRVGLFEVLGMTDTLRERIHARASGEEIARVARTEGMITLKDDALRKAALGLTTLDEALRVTAGDGARARAGVTR